MSGGALGGGICCQAGCHDAPQAAGPSVLARGGTNNVLMILKKVTRVTRILRLMRLVKLFQQYLVRRAPVRCL